MNIATQVDTLRSSLKYEPRELEFGTGFRRLCRFTVATLFHKPVLDGLSAISKAILAPICPVIEPREIDNNDLKASRAQEWRPRCSQALAQWVVEIPEET